MLKVIKIAVVAFSVLVNACSFCSSSGTMPTELQLLRATAITAYFKDSGRETDNFVKSKRPHKLVFAFCKSSNRIFCSIRGSAFALLTDWGSVVTWGDPKKGGDSAGAAEQLSCGVQTVVGNASAFAAVKVDGSVVTWGAAISGGEKSIFTSENFFFTTDSRSVATELSVGVQTVVGNDGALGSK